MKPPTRDELRRRIENASANRDERGRFTVAEEASGLVGEGGQRTEHYGEPVKNHTDIGVVWAVLLSDWQPGTPIPPRLVAIMMAALKLVREGGPKAKRDNLVDACGYLLIAEMATDDKESE